MDKRPSQVSFYLAISCLTLSICVFVVVVGVLYQKWNPPENGGPPTAQNSPTKLEDFAGEPDRYALEDLNVELGEYLNAELDEGRVKIAPLMGWQLPSRSKDYLVCLKQSQAVALPRITVTVEEASLDDLQTVDEDNLDQLSRFVLDGMPEGDRKRIIEPIKPLVLGDTPCIRYVIRSKPTRFKKSAPARTYERQVLKTLQKGRLYTVTLDVFESTIKDYRDAGYAVMAGLQFIEPEEEKEPEEEETK
jgi:hypothetical protein